MNLIWKVLFPLSCEYTCEIGKYPGTLYSTWSMCKRLKKRGRWEVLKHLDKYMLLIEVIRLQGLIWMTNFIFSLCFILSNLLSNMIVSFLRYFVFIYFNSSFFYSNKLFATTEKVKTHTHKHTHTHTHTVAMI